jgi:hypothetical protein
MPGSPGCDTGSADHFRSGAPPGIHRGAARPDCRAGTGPRSGAYRHVALQYPGIRLLHARSGHAALPHSWEAALRAAGAVVEATDRVMDGRLANAFCAVRPPGHHARAASAMGFCLLNNVAVGVHHALEAHGLERVAVVDFDVHHGNGTEEILAAIEGGQERVLMASFFSIPSTRIAARTIRWKTWSMCRCRPDRTAKRSVPWSMRFGCHAAQVSPADHFRFGRFRCAPRG